MAETIIIDVRTNYQDNMSPQIEASAKALDRLEESLQRVNKMMNSLNGSPLFDMPNGGKMQASFDIQDNASKKLDTIMRGVKTLSGIGTIKFGIEILDKVTQPLQMVLGQLKGLGNEMLTRGWSRVVNIDKAKAKLKGLGNSAEAITEISNNALAAVNGTAYGLDEAVTAAASAVAAGLKPGKDLEKYLVDIADLAGIAGTSMGDMGNIMNAVVTTGKAQNDTLQRLAERGLPVYQWLAKTMGTTEDQITAMAKNGEIGITQLQAAVEENIHGAAQAMGDATITGVIDNIHAAYAKIGEALIGASDDQKSLAGQAHEFLLAYKTDLNTVKGPLKEVGETLGNFVGQIRPQAIAFMDKAFAGLVDRIQDLNSVMNSQEFQNADLLGKFKIAWDTVIGDPLSKWWDTKGHDLFIGKANALGEDIGSGLSTIMKGIFGLNSGDMELANQATTIGAGFAQGFLHGFDGSGVAKAIADSIANALKSVFSSLVDGKLSGTSILNGLLLGFGGKNLMGGIKTLSGLFGGKGLGNIFTGGGVANVTTAATGMERYAAALGRVSALSTAHGGLVDEGDNIYDIDRFLTAPKPHAGIPVANAAAFSVAALAVAGGIKDLVTASKQNTEIQKRATKTSGWSRLGAVGVGAAAGAVAGPLGALFGAATGGLISLFMGNELKRHAEDTNKSLERLTKGTDEYAKATDYAQRHMATLSITTDQVNSAVEKVYGTQNAFVHGNSQIVEGQNYFTQANTSAQNVEGMNTQMQNGISLTQEQADTYGQQVMSAMDNSLSSVMSYGAGMLENFGTFQSAGGNVADLEAQANAEYSKQFKSTKEKLEKNQEEVKGLYDSYTKGDITLDEFAKKATPFVADSTQLASEFTSMQSSMQKAASVSSMGNFDADSVEKMSEAFKQMDEANSEQYRTASTNAKLGYAKAFGLGSDEYAQLAKNADIQTFINQSRERVDSLSQLNGMIDDALGSDLGSYINNADSWYKAMSNLENDATTFTAVGTGTQSIGEAMNLQLNRNKQYSGLQASAQDYGASIAGWVDEVKTSINQMKTEGMEVPQSMMESYKSGIEIMAAAGYSNAMVQQQAFRLIQDVNDENSQYHDEAVDMVGKILSDTDHYFRNENVEQAFTEALKFAMTDTTDQEYKGLQKQATHEFSKKESEKTGTTDKTQEYEVKHGDTVIGILRQLLGHEPTKEDIQNFQTANQKVLDKYSGGDINLIFPGEKFTISGGKSGETTEEGFTPGSPQIKSTKKKKPKLGGKKELPTGNGIHTFGTNYLTGKPWVENTPEDIYGAEDKLHNKSHVGTMEANIRSKVGLNNQKPGAGAVQNDKKQEMIETRYGENGTLSNGRTISSKPETFGQAVVGFFGKAGQKIEKALNIPQVSDEYTDGLIKHADEVNAKLKEAESNTLTKEEASKLPDATSELQQYIDMANGKTTSAGGNGTADQLLVGVGSGGEVKAPSSSSSGMKESFWSSIVTGLEGWWSGFTLPGFGITAQAAEAPTSGATVKESTPAAVAPETMVGVGTTVAPAETTQQVVVNQQLTPGSVDNTQLQSTVQESAGEPVNVDKPVNMTLQPTVTSGVSGVADTVSAAASVAAQASSTTTTANPVVDATGVPGMIDATSVSEAMRAAAETPVSATVPVNAQAAGTVYVPVTVVPQLNVQSASATVAATSGGTGSATVTVGGVQKKKNGGLVDSAELTWVGDEGYPEMIIPFAPHRRSRALELLSQTEDALGISKHANGGVVGGMLPSSKSDGENGNSDAKPKSGGNGSVSVGNISFQINGNGGDVVSQVQSRASEITEIVTNALADALEQAYENTPYAAG